MGSLEEEIIGGLIIEAGFCIGKVAVHPIKIKEESNSVEEV